jgi:dTDP-4-dehydrorhamnose reductase
MTKIVVLGSNGQLGSDLMIVLPELNHNIIGVTRQEFDVNSDNMHSKLTQYADANYIINCIATTNVDGCEDNQQLAYNINSIFVADLAKFCSEHNIILIHISTDYVFDGQKNTPYTEEDKPNPLNIYGLSKYAGELAIKTFAAKYFIFRVASLFGIAGASGKGGNFVTTMLRLANDKDSFTVINDQYTCPTHTLDISRAIKAVIKQNLDEYGIYNCVSSSSCSWFEFTQEILRQCGFDPHKVRPISYKEYAFRAMRPQYGVLDIKKLSRYYQMPDYKSALKEFLQLKHLR